MPIVLDPEIKKESESLSNVRRQRLVKDQKKKLREASRETVEMKSSKTFISLEEAKRSIEHYGDLIKVDSPHAHGDSIPRPPSRSPSEVLPYVMSKTLVRDIRFIDQKEPIGVKSFRFV